MLPGSICTGSYLKFFGAFLSNGIESTYVSEKVLPHRQVSLAFNPVICGIYGILRVV